MTTTKKLMLGFGTLTMLLVVAVAAIYFRVQAIDYNVGRVSEFARPRSVVTQDLETNVAEFTLHVRTGMQLYESTTKQSAKTAIDEVDKNLADYERLAQSDQQREMAAQLQERWNDLQQIGRKLMVTDRGAIPPADSRMLADKWSALQKQIEAVQQDAGEKYDTRRLQVRSDIKAVVGFALFLLIAGVLVAVVTSIVVGAGILSSEKVIVDRERQFATLAESIPHLAWMAKSDGHIFWYNQRWYDYTGTTLAQMEGWGWQSVHDPNELPKVLERWQASIATGSPFDMVFPLKGGDGAFRTFLTRVVPVKDANGKVTRWFGTNTDISDAKRTADELHDARSRLESMLTIGEIGTWVYDLARNSIRADRNLARMFNVTTDASPDEFIAAIHPDDRVRVKEATSRAIETGVAYDVKYRIRATDGSTTVPWRWVVARGRLERDASGRAVGLPGVVIDITAQQLADERLAEQSRRFDLMLSSISDFAYTFDLEGRFTYMNKALLDLWGITQEQAVGKNFHDLKYPYDLAETLQRQIQDVVRTGTRVVDETPYTSPTGKAGVYQYIFSPVMDADGRVIAVAGFTRDMTAQKDIEQALRKSEEKLQDADRRKNEFLATLAHELRNPLAPIRNGIHILKSTRAEGATTPDILPMMERQLTHMVRLVDDLMDVSRITRGRLELRKKRIDFSAVVKTALETSRPLIDANRHMLNVNVPSEPIQLDADLTRLSQVFSNLLNNAAKYTPDGGHIEFTAKRRDGEVIVSVKDSGSGIPPAMLSKVFEMFTQVDRTLERAQGGMGIGLTLVKKLVELHGGTVEARSAGTGQGSEFIVRLPILESSAPLRTADASGLRRATAGLRILVVDDNNDAAETLSMMLTMMGHQVRVFHDGLAGVEAARESMPDVMLLDIGLPFVDGYEVCRRIRSLPGGDKPVIIACTGWGQDEDRRLSQEAGFTTHIVKPVDPVELEKFIARLPRPEPV